MNKKDLILTSTVGMPREAWLEFRQPLTHIRSFFKKWVDAVKGPQPEYFTFDILKEFFSTDAWKDFVFPCIGGSEVATLLALNPYKSIIELYYEKIGAKPIYDFDNVAMFWGRELEEQIAEKWQYWDGSPEGLINNFKEDNIIRKCRRLNAYVQNKKFPWLFVSLDRVINKQMTGKEEVNEGSLECKTISGYSAAMWESGIPPMYVAQLQGQLLACDFGYGEISILKDGRYFEVYPFDKHDIICDRIIKTSKAFFELVKEGAKQFLLYSHCQDEEKMNYYAELERIAPEPDGSEAYKNYLSEKYSQEQPTGILGGIVEETLAQDYKYFAEEIKVLDLKQTEAANKLKAFMKENIKIDLGKAGSVTWKDNGKGSRTFRVNVKLDPGHVPEANGETTGSSDTVKPEAKETAEKVAEVPFENSGEKRTGRKKKEAGA